MNQTTYQPKQETVATRTTEDFKRDMQGMASVIGEKPSEFIATAILQRMKDIYQSRDDIEVCEETKNTFNSLEESGGV